jgi:serine/threonine-protein kinase
LTPARFGKYDLLVLLATGGMAEIWLARISGAAGFEKLVVIKRLLDQLAVNPEYVEMFLDEARINARLTHSNVVTVLELGQVEGKYFIAMEYVAGLSVAQVGKKATQRLGDVPQAVACGVVAQACAGLHYAHERTLPDGTPLGIIHRDVSPQNLILTFEGQVKVVDFGIAKAEGRQHRTRAGLVKGKSSYMSPEQCLGLPLDRRSDVFALGIVLYELCTARRLFKRGSSYATFEAITKADVPPPRALNPKIDASIEEIILKALARKQDDRYSTAGELQETLETAMRKLGLRGSRSDLEKFVEHTFKAEIAEQRNLLADAQKGELTRANPAAISAVAEHAADEAKAAYKSDPEVPKHAPAEDEDVKTTIDAMPYLGEDSGRTPLADPADIPAPASSPSPVEFDAPPTEEARPTAVIVDELAYRPQRQVPPVYYVMAAVGALLVAAAVVWLLAF